MYYSILSLSLFIVFYSSHFIFIILFFFNDTATTEIYTLSLHDAVPALWGAPDLVLLRILVRRRPCRRRGLPADGGRIEGCRKLSAAGRFQRCGVPRRVRRTDRSEVVAHRSLEDQADPSVEPGVRPLLDRE